MSLASLRRLVLVLSASSCAWALGNGTSCASSSGICKQLDVVIVTDDHHLLEDGAIYTDNYLIDELRSQGLRVGRETYLEPTVDWSGATIALPRSAWDRYFNYEEWVDWYHDVHLTETYIVNQDIFDWTLSKDLYLPVLQEKGINVAPFVILEGYDEDEVPDCDGKDADKVDCNIIKNILEVNGWEALVFKPSAGNIGRDVSRANRETAAEMEETAQDLLEDVDKVIFQEFQNDVPIHGERSVYLIGRGESGELLHGIWKRAKVGGFLVHDDRGGSSVHYDPTEEEVKFAKHVFTVLKDMGYHLDIVRVDIITDNRGDLALNDIAVTTPAMWMENCPKWVVQKFASYIKEVVARVEAMNSEFQQNILSPNNMDRNACLSEAAMSNSQ